MLFHIESTYAASCFDDYLDEDKDSKRVIFKNYEQFVLKIDKAYAKK